MTLTIMNYMTAYINTESNDKHFICIYAELIEGQYVIIFLALAFNYEYILTENAFNFSSPSRLHTIKTFKTIEYEGWRRHSGLIFLILLFTKPNIEVSGWLY